MSVSVYVCFHHIRVSRCASVHYMGVCVCLFMYMYVCLCVCSCLGMDACIDIVFMYGVYAYINNVYVGMCICNSTYMDVCGYVYRVDIYGCVDVSEFICTGVNVCL